MDYTFRDLNPNNQYNIYVKTVCDSKSSYWLGPLLISFDSYNMHHTGDDTATITPCSKVIYDSGGPNGNYENNAAYPYLYINSRNSGKITLKGIINTEKKYDYLDIYSGTGTSKTLLGKYSGYKEIPLFISNSFTIYFQSDSSNTYPGFHLTIGCIVYSPQTIYSLIKGKSCYKISCINNWKDIQIFLVSCINDCKLTSKKYEYRGICYDNCPAGTTNKNFV